MTPSEIRNFRNIHSLTQSELAEKLKVTLRTVQNWESGTVNIPKKHINTINVLRTTFNPDNIYIKENAKLKGQLLECRTKYQELLETLKPLIK